MHIMPMQQRSITLPAVGDAVPSCTLAYTEWGDASAEKVVVCVHGLTRNARDFDYLAAGLAGAGARVICVDIIGRGESDWLTNSSGYGYPTYVAQILMLLQQLQLGPFFSKPVRWVGTSMGGLIGMMLAASMPGVISRMVMNDVGPFISAAALGRIASYVGQTKHFASEDEAKAALKINMRPFGITEPTHWEHVFAHSIKPDEKGGFRLNYDPAIADVFREADGSLKALEDVDLWPLWEQIQLPLLLLRGAESDVLDTNTAEKMAQKPNVQLITYPGIGHAPALMDDRQIGDVKGFVLG